MAIAADLQNQLAAAYTSGDIAGVNSLLGQNQLTAADVQSTWNFTPDQMGQLSTAGVNYFSPLAAAATDVAASAPAGPPDAALAQFNNYMQGGDYNAAGALAASYGYNPTQVSDYVNATYGLKTTADQASQFMPTAISKYDPSTGIEGLYQSILGRGSDAPGLQYWQQQFGDTVDPNEIYSFYNAAKPELDIVKKVGAPLLYPTLTAQSTPEQISAAYDQYVRGVGGESADAQASALKYLRDIGIADPTIQQAYQTYQTPRQFVGEGGITDLATLNRGFEWAQANKIDDAALKRTLGEDRYNAYTQQYRQGILNYLQPVFADGKLSAEEALDVVTRAKQFGLDSADISKYTGLKTEIPDALFNTYDRVVSGIVGNALDPAKDMTEQQRAGSVLALQSKYGISDADIAKYSNGKITEKQATDYLSPIRNFSTDIQGLFAKPDVTAKDISDFIDKSRNSSGVMSFYGDRLNEFDQKLDTMEQKWERFGTDPFQTEQLYNQINGITNAAGGKNWSGDWMSGGDNAAMEAAARLQKLGVDSLKDLKVTPQFQETKAVEMYNGQPVTTDDQGRKYISLDYYDDSGRPAEKQYLPTGAQTQVVYPKVVGYAGESGGEYTEYVPLTADELKTYDPKTGQFDLLTGKNLIDASTGKVISNSGDGKNFVIDQYETGNFFKGKDKTFGLMMNDAGVPIPYTSTEKTGLVTTPILPLLLSFLAPGVANFISGALPGAASATALSVGPGLIPATTMNTLASNVLTGGIAGGVTAVARDEDFWKGFGKGALNPAVNFGVSSLMPNILPEGINPTIGKAITNTAGNLVTSAITGQGNVGDILTSGIMSGASDYFLTPALQSLNLSPTELKLLTNVGIPAAFGQKVNPYSLISTLASTGKPAGAK